MNYEKLEALWEEAIASFLDGAECWATYRVRTRYGEFYNKRIVNIFKELILEEVGNGKA